MGACATRFKRLKDEPLPLAAVKELASSKENPKFVEETLDKNDPQPPAAADGDVKSRSLGFLFEENIGKASEDVAKESLSEPVSSETDVIKSVITEEKKSDVKAPGILEAGTLGKKSEDKPSSSEAEKEKKEIEELKLASQVKSEIEEIGIEEEILTVNEKKQNEKRGRLKRR